MPQVSSTISTDYFCSSHEEGVIFVQFDVFHIDWIVEARPSRSRFKLGVRGEQRLSTGDTIVHSCFMVVVQRATECSFGSLLPDNFVLFWSKSLFPIGLG